MDALVARVLICLRALAVCTLQAVARSGGRVESRNFMYKELGDVLGRCVFR
jgi:hypothetical protein